MINSFTPLLGLPLPLLARQFIQPSSVVFTVGSVARCALFVSVFMRRFYIVHWQNFTDEIYRERKGQVIWFMIAQVEQFFIELRESTYPAGVLTASLQQSHVTSSGASNL